jgi:hypothetical protein
MGARQLRLLAVFCPKDCSDINEELLIALLGAFIYYRTIHYRQELGE